MSNRGERVLIDLLGSLIFLFVGYFLMDFSLSYVHYNVQSSFFVSFLGLFGLTLVLIVPIRVLSILKDFKNGDS